MRLPTRISKTEEKRRRAAQRRRMQDEILRALGAGRRVQRRASMGAGMEIG